MFLPAVVICHNCNIVSLNGQVLQWVESVKYLGVLFLRVR